MASGELERIVRELRASLALARPDSPVRGPILGRLAAIDAELSGRQASRPTQANCPAQPRVNAGQLAADCRE
jgi:hypothetical protein